MCLLLSFPVAHHGVDMMRGRESAGSAFIDCHEVSVRCWLWLCKWRRSTGRCGRPYRLSAEPIRSLPQMADVASALCISAHRFACRDLADDLLNGVQGLGLLHRLVVVAVCLDELQGLLRLGLQLDPQRLLLLALHRLGDYEPLQLLHSVLLVFSRVPYHDEGAFGFGSLMGCLH